MVWQRTHHAHEAPDARHIPALEHLGRRGWWCGRVGGEPRQNGCTRGGKRLPPVGNAGWSWRESSSPQ